MYDLIDPDGNWSTSTGVAFACTVTFYEKLGKDIFLFEITLPIQTLQTKLAQPRVRCSGHSPLDSLARDMRSRQTIINQAPSRFLSKTISIKESHIVIAKRVDPQYRPQDI